MHKYLLHSKQEIYCGYIFQQERLDENKMFRSYSGYVDFDKYNINRILSISGELILPLGGKGEFDEFGSMAGSIIRHQDKYLLYYCGWTRCTHSLQLVDWTCNK